MNVIARYLVLLCLGVLITFHAGHAHAQQPAQEPYTQEEFEELTKVFRHKPNKLESLEFTIRLPKDWTQQEVSEKHVPVINDLLLADIAKFHGPARGDVPPFVSIQAIEIGHEILAQHWLKNFIFDNGYVPMQEIEEIAENRAYGAYVVQTATARYLMTATVRIHRNWAIVAQFALPVRHYQAFRNLPDLSIKSFTLEAPPEGQIEEWRNFSLLSALRFSYPSSWIISNPDFTDPNRPSVELHNKPAPPENQKPSSKVQNDRLDGLIKFEAIRKIEGITLKRELIRLRNRIERFQDLKVESLERTMEPEKKVRFNFGSQEIYNIKFWKPIIDQELWFTVFEDEEYYVFVYMLTPKEKELFYQWARNTLVYQKIIGNLK